MDLERLRHVRALALERGDLNVVRELDDYAVRCGFVIFEVDVLETAEPPAMEHAVPPMRRGPGRPRKEA